MATNEFYFKNDIQKELCCSFCQNRLDVPKLIPCGKVICSKCESHLIKSANKQCKSCSAVHEMPTSGFPIIQLIANLLKIAPAKVYRGEVHKQTMEMVNEIGLMNKNLHDQMKNIDPVVSDYCDMLRSCVDIKTESAINQLNAHRDLFLRKIESYEKQCKKKSDLESLKLEEFITECNKHYDEWSHFLNKENISDKDTSEVLKEATEKMNNLIEFKKKFEKSVFGPRKLVFRENEEHIKTNIIGVITSSNQEMKMKFNYRREQGTAYHNPLLINLDDKSVCMTVTIQYNNANIRRNLKNNSFELKLAIITESEVVKEFKEAIHPIHYNKCITIKLKENIISHYCASNGQWAFKTFDYNLKLIKSITSNSLLTALLTDDKRIYGLSEESIWSIYDENLELLESINIGDGSVYPFIKHINSQIELKHGCIFIFYNNELTVIDNEKRTLVVTLKLDEKTYPNPVFVKPCSSDSFCLINPKNNMIQIFDFELNCFQEFKVDFIPQISSVSLSNDGDIVLYDHNAFTAYLLE